MKCHLSWKQTFGNVASTVDSVLLGKTRQAVLPRTSDLRQTAVAGLVVAVNGPGRANTAALR